MSQEETPKIYQRVKNRLAIFSLVLDALVLVVFFFGGWSFWLQEISFSFSDSLLLGNTAYLLLFSLGYYVIHFPLSMFTGFLWEHKFQLSNQSFLAWFVDDLKKTALGLVVFFVLVHAIFTLLSTQPQHWWISAAFFWLMMSFVMAKLTPNVIIPLFYKYSTIEDQLLRERIQKLFKASKVLLKDVYAVDFSKKTKKANAFLCGIGKQRRVVLSDTLLEKFDHDEIEVVVAHELAHLKHHDIFKMLITNFFVIFCGFFLVDQYLRYAVDAFYLPGISDISLFPLVALTLMAFGFFTTPLLNAYSRRIERNADRFSLQKTSRPAAFISLMKKLGEMNLSDFDPGFLTEVFFYDHPPLGKRIRFAKQFST